MAIIRAFEECRPQLAGTLYPIQVLHNHKNLEYFISMKLLNYHQTLYTKYLSCFNVKIVCHPEKLVQNLIP
jgi:hypothetical protein